MIKASYTLELSLLMPFILGMILFIFYVSLFFYNYGVMKITAFSVSAEAAEYSNFEEDNGRTLLDSLCKEKIRGELIGVDDVCWNVQIREHDFIISYEGTMEVPFFEMFLGQDLSGWKLSVKECCKKIEPGKWIQNIRRIKEVGDTLLDGGEDD